MLHIPLPIMCHLPRIRLRKRRSPPCSICFVFYIAFSTCGPLGTLFVSTKPSPDHRDTSCYGVYTTLSYRICIIHRLPIDSPTRHFLVGRKAGILTASRHHFLYFPRVFRIPSREMESEVVALEKVQESQESPARNPSLHLSQDMRAHPVARHARHGAVSGDADIFFQSLARRSPQLVASFLPLRQLPIPVAGTLRQPDSVHSHVVSHG